MKPIQNSKFKIQNFPFQKSKFSIPKFKIPHSKIQNSPFQNSKFPIPKFKTLHSKIQNSPFQIQNSPFQIQNSEFKTLPISVRESYLFASRLLSFCRAKAILSHCEKIAFAKPPRQAPAGHSPQSGTNTCWSAHCLSPTVTTEDGVGTPGTERWARAVHIRAEPWHPTPAHHSPATHSAARTRRIQQKTTFFENFSSNRNPFVSSNVLYMIFGEPQRGRRCGGTCVLAASVRP